MGKDKKLKGKQPKVDPKGKDPSCDKYVSSAAEIAEDKQARLSVALEIVRKQPAHPPPVRMAPPSASLPLTKLDKEPKKKKDSKERKGSHSRQELPFFGIVGRTSLGYEFKQGRERGQEDRRG
jgi:hypothetical protein